MDPKESSHEGMALALRASPSHGPGSGFTASGPQPNTETLQEQPGWGARHLGEAWAGTELGSQVLTGGEPPPSLLSQDDRGGADFSRHVT